MDLLNMESIMLTRIEYRVSNSIGEQYPNLNFTSEVSDNPPSFPNVYVHEETNTEVGNDLQNRTFNASNLAIQLVIKTNTNKADCLQVRNACIDAIKKDGFRIVINDPQKINNIWQATLHMYGVRGAGDNFIN